MVIEEGHRFGTDANLRSLLIEGRKFCRKVIRITTDWSDLRGIAKVYKPRPWELKLEGVSRKPQVAVAVVLPT